jgi:hypothetical protein
VFEDEVSNDRDECEEKQELGAAHGEHDGTRS